MYANLTRIFNNMGVFFLMKSREKILEIFKRKVEERKRINGDENLRMERDDLLNWLMKNTTNGFEEIGDTLLHTLFGGHDTTSRAICLLLYFLDGCPKAIQQLRVRKTKS